MKKVTIGATHDAQLSTENGSPVWNWFVCTVGDGNDEPIAGGYCATEADALNDARVWCSLNQRTISPIETLIQRINAECVRLNLLPLCSEQLALLRSDEPEDAQECADMLEDLRHRCGLQIDTSDLV